MSKKRTEKNQMTIDFDAKIETYEAARIEMLRVIDEPGPALQTKHGDADEICVEIAAACKRAIRVSGLSRDQLCDEINLYFGFSAPDSTHKPISIHMLNHYLSKPVDHPIPIYYIYAIQRITESLDPIKTVADAFGARVITGAEVRQMTLGKLDDTISEMQRLKRELKHKGQ